MRPTHPRVSRRSFRIALLIFAGSAVIALGIGGYYGYKFYTYPDSALWGSGKKVEVVIPKNATVHDAIQLLVAKGLISHPRWFSFYAKRAGLTIHPGTYLIGDSWTPEQVIQTLSFPPAVPLEEIKDIQVTIREGKSIVNVARALASLKLAPSFDVALAAERDPKLVKQLGLPDGTPSLEGYLFPDTYRFRPGTPLPKIFEKMVNQQRAVYAQLVEENKATLAQVKSEFHWTDREVVIMASIVEKETAAPEERPRIAAVFMNRIRNPDFTPKLLQTDPTITYGCTALVEKSDACDKFEGRIRKPQLVNKDNPYNTYTHEGLPPGPISNPGRLALAAVMKPEGSDFLYFVSKNDGTHVFSKNKADHEAAVLKYQKKKKAPETSPN